MSVLKTIKLYFKLHKIKLVLIILMIITVTLLSLVPAQILRIIVDDSISNSKIKTLFIFSLFYGISYVIIGIITFIKDLIMLSTSQDITFHLRCNMMKHVHKMEYKSLIDLDSGVLESYFNNDVDSINELFTSGVVNVATDLFKIIGILITIFIYSLTFGFLILAIIPFLVLFTLYIKKRMMKAQLKTKFLEGNVNKTLLENVENIEQIKVNKAEEYAKDKYKDILESHFKVSQASNFYDGSFPVVMNIVRNIIIVGILLLSGYNSSIFGMTVGMIISAISLIADLFTPIEALGMEIQTIQKSFASIKRIDELFLIPTDEEKEKFELDNFDISFNNVSFSYKDNNEKSVISNFSLEIKQGEKIAIQGPSGVGKSTLMKLTMGILKPTTGLLTIGNISPYYFDDYTKKKTFSIVYQDPFFSNGTIFEEISLLDKNITLNDVRNALDNVGLNYVTDLNKQFKFNDYSSGELALFNIARVVVRDTDIVFLDEMNSKIDPITASKIMETINKITKNKTVISINHYGNILDNAKIIKLT